MRSIVCSLLLAGALMGQTVGDGKVAIANLTATLTGIGKADASPARLSGRLAGDMLALVDRDHEPSVALVTGFAEQLTAALYGKELSSRYVTMLQQSIVDVMRGSSATFAAAASLRQVLNEAGVDSTKAQLVTRRFISIGEEIKGPDDVGARGAK